MSLVPSNFPRSYMTDVFEVLYEKVHITGDGLCGFRCLSYSFTGTQSRFGDIIHDCISFFHNYPTLLTERTDFGRQQSENNNSVVQYERLMEVSILRAHNGEVLLRETDKVSWCEDGHFTAISLLFDISIFVYESITKKWVVFNDQGQNGYICLCSEGDHFEVLRVPGEDFLPTPIPQACYKQGESRSEFSGWNDAAAFLVSNRYDLCHVSKWTNGIPEVSLINAFPAITSNDNATNMKSTKTRQKTTFHCETCPHAQFSTQRALTLHKYRVHSISQKNDYSVPASNIPSSNTTPIQANKDFFDLSSGDSSVDEPSSILPSSTISSHTKQQCPLCNKFFVNLNNHKKCTKKRSHTVLSTDHHISRFDSVANEGNDDLTSPMPKQCNEFEFRLPAPPRRSSRLLHQQPSQILNTDRPSNTVINDTYLNTSHLDSSNTQMSNKECRVRKRLLQRKSQRHIASSINDMNLESISHNCTSNSEIPTETAYVHLPDIEIPNECVPPIILRQQRKRYFNIEAKKILQQFKKKMLPPTNELMVEDPLHIKLKRYHDHLSSVVDNIVTQKISAEAAEVIDNTAEIDNEKRPFSWSVQDETRLNLLNVSSKQLQCPPQWTWAAKDDSPRGIYNNKRMEFCVERELVHHVIQCPQCGSTGILVGLNQINASVCYDCLVFNEGKSKSKQKQAFTKAWEKVKPRSQEFPKRTEQGHEQEDLPFLHPGDRAVIAPVHPVVTVRKNFYDQKKLRQECISLQQDPAPTWCRILPRTELKNRFMVIERRAKDDAKRYIVASPDRVRQWLRYLFKHHTGFIRMKRNNELCLSEEAVTILESQSELAEVDFDPECEVNDMEDIESQSNELDHGIGQASLHAPFSENHTFTFDKYNRLYINNKEMIKIRKAGKMEIIEDQTLRKPIYCASATLSFPYLYPNGEASPLDFGNYTLARRLLKKQVSLILIFFFHIIKTFI
jgi:hypothetical protein